MGVRVEKAVYANTGIVLKLGMVLLLRTNCMCKEEELDLRGCSFGDTPGLAHRVPASLDFFFLDQVHRVQRIGTKADNKKRKMCEEHVV